MNCEEVLKILKEFEKKYGMSSEEFYDKWSKGSIPEPDDPEVHSDFQIWSGLIELLKEKEK